MHQKEIGELTPSHMDYRKTKTVAWKCDKRPDIPRYPSGKGKFRIVGAGHNVVLTNEIIKVLIMQFSSTTQNKYCQLLLAANIRPVASLLLLL